MKKYYFACQALLCVSPLLAALFGSVRVVVRDPQNLIVPNVEVVLRAKASDWSKAGKTNSEGQIVFEAVAIGQYLVSVSAEGFKNSPGKEIGVNSNTVTPVELQLDVEGTTESVTVSAVQAAINPESSTTQNLTNRLEISRTPDADRSGSLAMITKNVPGAFVMHDHLHSRGGHGVAWEVDGVPIPSSNLASVGSQFDPKDVDYLEVQRGGYSAQYGDRSYGVFNVVPRTGFEGKRFGEFQATYGSFHQTNEYMSFGSHTNRFAYYASLAGSRTDLGLERPDLSVLHDQQASFSGFTSLIFNATPKDQLRFVGAVRHDHYQVPNTTAQQQIGIRDTENADDSFANFSWVHTPGSGVLLTVSPYYHYNQGHYVGGKNDLPISTEDDRNSNYVGGYVTLALTRGKHTARLGTDSYAQHDSTLFGLTRNDGSGLSLVQRQTLWAGLAGFFAEDSYRVASWLTLNGGLRYTRFSGTVSERSVAPRAGLAIKMPHLGWVLRASYGRYYQHPPLSTISGPLREFALQEGFDFLPLRGERDEVWEVGLGIPIRGWTLDFDHFHNNATNVVDHEVLGNSNLLLPLTIPRGRIRGWESTLHSPRLWRRLEFHWAFSNMSAQGRGQITGGLTDFEPPSAGFFYLDHDQRVTVSTGFDLNLPRRLWTSGTVVYGSGFLRGNGPDHMPHHATFDLALGKEVAENWSVRLTLLNLMNNEYLTGFENSFAGTHYNYPREISVKVRYRFHF